MQNYFILQNHHMNSRKFICKYCDDKDYVLHVESSRCPLTKYYRVPQSKLTFFMSRVWIFRYAVHSNPVNMLNLRGMTIVFCHNIHILYHRSAITTTYLVYPNLLK